MDGNLKLAKGIQKKPLCVTRSQLVPIKPKVCLSVSNLTGTGFAVIPLHLMPHGHPAAFVSNNQFQMPCTASNDREQLLMVYNYVGGC